MAALSPLPTTGITGGVSETGIATVEVPVFVATLGEGALWGEFKTEN